MKKKILAIAPLPPPRHGMAMATEILVDSEIKDYFQLEIINTNSEELKDRWEFSFKRIWQILKTWAIYFRKIEDADPDMVYLTIAQSRFGFLKDCFYIALAKVKGKKCAVHFHGGLFAATYRESNFLLRRVMVYFLNLADAIIVLAESLKSSVPDEIEKEKIHVIPNCVGKDLTLSDNEILKLKEKISRQDRDPVTVLYFSNLIKSKGYFDVLESAVELKNYPIKFLFAGSWMDKKDAEEAEKFIENQHLEEKVAFLGHVLGDKKKELLMRSDIFVLPTYYPSEGLPIVLLEAMACGLAVIVTPYRGIRDIFSEGENGLFVPPQNPHFIADKIKILSQNKSLRIKIMENNIAKVNKEFTEEIFINKFSRLFGKLTFN